MNTKVQTTPHGTEHTGITNENGRSTAMPALEQEAANRRFGLMDLWAIRRNGRKFRIHNRIPRL